MPISPEDVTKRKFPLVRGRGYSPAEVDAFLSQLASDYGAALEKVAEASRGSPPSLDKLGTEIVAVLEAAQESAAEMRGRAEAEAERTRREAIEEAAAVEKRARQEERSTLKRVSAEAATMMEDAEQHARNVREATERECKELLEEARRRSELLRTHETEAAQRIARLEDLVKKLRQEVESLLASASAGLDEELRLEEDEGAVADSVE